MQSFLVGKGGVQLVTQICFVQVSAAVRKMQEEVEARQRAEAEAARLAEEQRIRVGPA